MSTPELEMVVAMHFILQNRVDKRVTLDERVRLERVYLLPRQWPFALPVTLTLRGGGQ